MLVPYPLCVMTFATLTAQTLNVSDIFLLLFVIVKPSPLVCTLCVEIQYDIDYVKGNALFYL